MIDLHLFLGRPVTYKGSDGEKLTLHIVRVNTMSCSKANPLFPSTVHMLYYSPVVCRSVWECPSISG